MHPLITNIHTMKVSEIESKINELGQKYFMTHNPDLHQQIINVLDTYKEELASRRYDEWQKMIENKEKGLDKLININ